MTVKQFVIFNYSNISNINNYNHNVKQLKLLCKSYKLKKTGLKKLLKERINKYLSENYNAYIIQKVYLKYLYNTWKNLHKFTKECPVNDTDFYTLDNISDINKLKLVYLKQEKNFYAFDINSLNKLITNNDCVNPYNRQIIDIIYIRDFKRLCTLTKILKIPILSTETDNLSYTKKLDLRVIAVFQKIESLGFIVDPTWFFNLEKYKLIKFMRELYDIWYYRAMLNNTAKRDICPPLGNPFINITNINSIDNLSTLQLKDAILNSIDLIINNQANTSNRYLGGCYVLQALTLVSPEAAIGLPWLYQTVIYNI